jgi:multidrug efflux pump subunit AcrA (membrane-fusion protein)
MVRRLVIAGIVVLVSILGAVTLMATSPKGTALVVEIVPTTVRIVIVEPQPVVLTVRSQGTVAPSTESEIIRRSPAG